MCGICACIGNFLCKDFIIDGLKKLEYRGYDSAGISFIDNNALKVIKTVGDIDALSKLAEGVKADAIIGHTRWATHGGVTVENAHPHLSQSGKLAIVHNGVIENYKDLKAQMDVEWKSSTDSEVFVNLIERQKEDCLIKKVISASKKVEGSFAIALLSADGEIVAGRRENPLYIAEVDGGLVATSDLYVLSEKTENYFALENDEFAVLKKSGVEFYDKNGEKIAKKQQKIEKFNKISAKFKNTHMESEIFEAKDVLEKTLDFYLKNGFSTIKIPENLQEINFIACGTAYHSGLVAAEYFKKIGLPSHTYIASEFRYGNEVLNLNALYVFISQSGETADTIASAKLIKESGCKMLAVTNTQNCFLNQICQNVLPTFAGKEIAVASTKAYLAQVFSLYLFACFLGGRDVKEASDAVSKFEIVDFPDSLTQYALKFKKIIFVGRGLDYITALEASLKLKEISYINSIAIASGELKHGTLALVDNETLVVGILTQQKTREKFLTNLEEVKARGGEILLVSNCIEEGYNCLTLPNCAEDLMPIYSVVPLQIFALKMCEKLGFNPDKPRNLAKSVTVE